MQDTLIELRSIYYELNKQSLLCNMSLSIQKGQVWQVLGRNGSGKTTLLKIIAGLISPDSGEVIRNSDATIYIGHRLGLKRHLTLRENLDWMLGAYGILFREDSLNIALEKFYLKQCINKMVDTLSEGQKQRVALLRLALIPAGLWLLDEPFNALDTNMVALLQNMIVEHSLQGGVVVLSSHQAFSLAGTAINKVELGHEHNAA